MAKTRTNIEDEVRVDLETSTEETTAEQAIDKQEAPEATISTGKKHVKIRATEDIDCLIACKPYKIAKDKEASVPVDVAAILCYAKKAYRI